MNRPQDYLAELYRVPCECGKIYIIPKIIVEKSKEEQIREQLTRITTLILETHCPGREQKIIDSCKEIHKLLDKR